MMIGYFPEVDIIEALRSGTLRPGRAGKTPLEQASEELCRQLLATAIRDDTVDEYIDDLLMSDHDTEKGQ